MKYMKKVIIAEPNIPILNHLERKIKECGHIMLVATVKNGKELYEKILEYKPDIVVTDEEMEILKGTDVLEKVQELEDKPEFIFATATYIPDIYEKLLKYHVRRYFMKPYNMDDLIEEIINE